MPIFTPNLTAVAAGIPLLEKGGYEFTVGEVKLGSRDVMVNEITVKEPVIQLILKIDSGESFVGKTIPFTLNPNGEFGPQFAKQFLIAAYGFTSQREQEFNQKFSTDTDWTIDTDNNVLGEVWIGLQGKKINAEVSQVVNKKDPNIMNNRFNWRPF